MQIVAWGPALALVCGLAACTETDKESPSGRRPNVLLISIDMLRSDRLSCYGHTRATSPAIDRLAAEGQVFETHVSSSSWTLPGHASLFTALPDSLHGAVDLDMRVPPATDVLGHSLVPLMHDRTASHAPLTQYLNCPAEAVFCAPCGPKTAS